MTLCPISHWRHGSTAPARELTRAEKRARYWELRASHKRVMLGRATHAVALTSDKFYRALLGGAEPLPRHANMRGYDVYDFDRGTQLAAEDVRVTDETEAARA